MNPLTRPAQSSCTASRNTNFQPLWMRPRPGAAMDEEFDWAAMVGEGDKPQKLHFAVRQPMKLDVETDCDIL